MPPPRKARLRKLFGRTNEPDIPSPEPEIVLPDGVSPVAPPDPPVRGKWRKRIVRGLATFLFLFIVLVGWLAWRRLLPQLRLGRPTAPWVLASAVLMVAGWVIFFQAMAYIPAGMAIVLFHVQPLWLLLLGALWLGEPIGRQRLLAVLVALLGLALATGVAQHLPLFANASVAESADGYWLGVALCMLGAVVMALLTLCVKKVPQVHASALTWWHCLLGTAVLWLGPAHSGWPAVGSTWLWLAGVGLVHTALAYTLIYAGTARLPMARLAVLQYVYPAVAIVIDWLYFRQTLRTTQIVGIAILTLAITVAERSPHLRGRP